MRYVDEKESFREYMRQFNEVFHGGEKYVIFGSGFKAAMVRKMISGILFYVDNDASKVGGGDRRINNKASRGFKRNQRCKNYCGCW